jgi:hypothetical protein
MKRIALIISVLCLGIVSLQAQEQKNYFSAQKGKWAVGVTFNPASMGSAIALQPKNGEFAGEYLAGLAANPKQMFIMSKDPMASIKFKYFTSSTSAFRMAFGINGSLVNYREYVQDDLAKALNPDSQNQVVDRATSSMNSFSMMLGKEWSKGSKSIRFIYGVDLMYTIAGGNIFFKYGNRMTDLNKAPSTMPMTQSGGDLNDFVDEDWGIAYGRPVKRNNIGYVHGLGISADAGLEIFLAENISLAAALNFTPVMITFQPQTYTVYEGFSAKTGKVEKVNGLVSPGSNALLYGTQNIGCRISLTYYL